MSEEIFGNLHSIESCGTVDGPGIRFVVFTQGCPMRCQYCHNPDTWDFKENHKVSVDEIVKQYEGVKEFCAGGVTVTGGEPMAQIEFVTELFKKLSEKGINTALDTSGVLFNKDNTAKVDELMKYTSIVLLDIKHIDDEEHKKLTKHSLSEVKLSSLSEKLTELPYSSLKEIIEQSQHSFNLIDSSLNSFIEKAKEIFLKLKTLRKNISIKPNRNIRAKVLNNLTPSSPSVKEQMSNSLSPQKCRRF